MRIGELCTREAVYCLPDTSVAEVARLMRNEHVGDVIVCERRDAKLIPVGVVTDRDLVVEVLAAGVPPHELVARDLATSAPVVAGESDEVHETIARMRTRGVRRLPVVDAAGFLVGVLSADDLAELLAEELTEVARIVPTQVRRERQALPPLQA